MQDEIKAQGTEAKVCADIAKRQQFGLNKYGTSVAENPLELRQWLQHAYEESLDLPIYLKRAIDELDASLVTKKDPARVPQKFDEKRFGYHYVTVLSHGTGCSHCAFVKVPCDEMLEDGLRPPCSKDARQDQQEVYFIKKAVAHGA